MSDRSSRGRGIAAGFSIVFVSSIAGKLFELGTRTLLARSLQPADFGNLMLGVTVLTSATTVAALGMQPTIARYVPQVSDDDRELVRVLLVTVGLPAVISIGGGGLLFWFAEPFTTLVFSGDLPVSVVRVFALVLPASVLGKIFIGYLRGEKEMRLLAVTEVFTTKTARVLLVAAGVVAGVGLLGFTAAVAGSYVVLFAVGLYFTVRRGPEITDHVAVVADSKQTVKELLSFSLPLFATSVLNRARREVDTLLVAVLLNPAAVGFYTATFPLALSLNLGLNAVGTVFMPSVSKLESEGDIGTVRVLYNETARWSMYLTLPALPFILVFSEEIVTLFFGSGYSAAASVLAIISTGVTVGATAGSVTDTIIGLGHSKLSMLLTLVGVVVNVVLNLALIPLFGLAGAAAATSMSIVSTNVLGTVFLFSRYGVSVFTRQRVYFLAFVVSSGAALETAAPLVPGGVLSLVLVGVVAYCLPLVLYVVTGVAPDEDVATAKALVLS